jgi:hypothetical protein
MAAISGTTHSATVIFLMRLSKIKLTPVPRILP